MIDTLITDVLVIGGGAAGLRAALAAAEAGSQVAVTNKGPVARSGITLTAAGGLQAPFHPDDSPDIYFADTVECGYGLGDKNLARVLADDACERALDVERYGARFVRNEAGEFDLLQFPGQSRRRNLFFKGGGVGLMTGLARACRKNERISLIDDFFVTGLIKGVGNGDVAGAMGLNLRTGQLQLIQAKATVMATGGCQRLWEVNDCPADATGDGIVYAYRAGAQLVDMEMVLFYPSVVLWPPSLQGALVHYEFLAPDSLDGNVYDTSGRPVLPKPLPVRDAAMRVMDQAVRRGEGTARGGLLWYVGDSPRDAAMVRNKLNTLQYNYIKQHGVDPATARIEVAPGAHYLLGGIGIDEECATSLTGLFATPECAGNFDGANRLAGSGLTATQVFGARAGLAAYRHASANGGSLPDSTSVEEEETRVRTRLGARSGEASVAELRQRLANAVQEYAGVSRDGAGLERLLAIVGELQATGAGIAVPSVARFNQPLVELLEFDAMCEAARIIAGSALLRQESRGHHYRSDYPFMDDKQWLKHTTAVRTATGPVFGTRQVK